MSLVHPGLINAKAGTERLHQANAEVRQYLQTEYREKDSAWVACDASKARTRAAPSATAETTCPQPDVHASPRKSLASIAILSENRLTRWLLPKGDSVGER
jgi:hypothetical protein